MREKFRICFTLHSFVYDLSYQTQLLGFRKAKVQTFLKIHAIDVATCSPLDFFFAYFLSQYLISSCFFYAHINVLIYTYILSFSITVIIRRVYGK